MFVQFKIAYKEQVFVALKLALLRLPLSQLQHIGSEVAQTLEAKFARVMLPKSSVFTGFNDIIYHCN